MLSVAKCYIEPPKHYQMCSPQKDFGVNQKIHSKCKGLLNTVEGNTDIVSNAELPQYIAEEQMYLYDTRKKSSDSDDHYVPLSG